MCGINGVWLYKHSCVELEKNITEMTKTLHHRGPNDSGIWVSQKSNIALGHRRLAIIDLSVSGHQPMKSHCGRYILVYNGEIYNYKELRKELISCEYQFHSHSDTEVLLAGLMTWGLENCLKKLNGMFAFALFDNSEKILYLARDRIGEKPLYYGWLNDAFIFASELKAIKKYSEFKGEIDKQSVAYLTKYGYIPTPFSIYKNVFKLIPGSSLIISKANLTQHIEPQIYWEIPKYEPQVIDQKNETHLIDKTETLLSQAVASRMISDVSIGSFLSGGVDSSLISALMQKNSQSAIKTFTIGFQEAEFNEAEYASAVAKHLKTDHTTLYVDPKQALAVIPQLPYIYDEPFADSSQIPTYLVSKLTKEHVTVCLSGDGGDEIFGGYNRYLITNALWKKIAFLPHALRTILSKFIMAIPSHYWDFLMRPAKIPSAGLKAHKLASMICSKTPDHFYDYIISQCHDYEKINKTRFQFNTLPRIEAITQLANICYLIEAMMQKDMLTYLPDDILVKVDRSSMAVGLETRTPFLDHHLIDFASKLPLSMKIRGNETKWLLRKILYKHVPKQLIERPKMGFGVPLASWLRGELRPWAEELLSFQRLNQQGFFHPAPILQKWRSHASGKADNQYALWPILMFQAWLETNEIN